MRWGQPAHFHPIPPDLLVHSGLPSQAPQESTGMLAVLGGGFRPQSVIPMSRCFASPTGYIVTSRKLGGKEELQLFSHCRLFWPPRFPSSRGVHWDVGSAREDFRAQSVCPTSRCFPSPTNFIITSSKIGKKKMNRSCFSIAVVLTTRISKFPRSPLGCWQCLWRFSATIGVPNVPVYCKSNRLHRH